MEKEFSECSESDQSLNHELGSISRSCLSHVSCWRCGSILVSNVRDSRFQPFYCDDKYFCHRMNSVKTLWENSIAAKSIER